MILSFIISTSLFFCFLILVSVRSFRQVRRPAGRLLFSADAGMAEEGEGASRETAVNRWDGRADIPAAGSRATAGAGSEVGASTSGEATAEVEASSSGEATNEMGTSSSAEATAEVEASLAEDAYENEYKENIYKGILWMKEKYEQYRDLADERYERLKEQLVKVEKKYEDLLASNGPAPVPDPLPPADVSSDAGAGIGMVIVEAATDREIQARVQELEEQFARERQRLEEEIARLRYQRDEEVSLSRRQLEDQTAEARRQLELHMQQSNRQLEEKQRIIVELEGQLRLDRQKIEELVAKLRQNGQLLLNIYQELDKTLHVTENPPTGGVSG